MMKKEHTLKVYDIGGKQVKKTKSLNVTQNNSLDNLVLSNHLLSPNQKTRKEKVTEEKICFFLDGNAMVYLNEDIFTVQPKDVLLLPVGSIFRLENYSNHVVVHYNIVSTQ